MVGYSHSWGEHRVFFQEPGQQRLRSLPASWTDVEEPDPFVTLARGRTPFRTAELLSLVALVHELSARECQADSPDIQRGGRPWTPHRGARTARSAPCVRRTRSIRGQRPSPIPPFTGGNPFFDRADLVQVKYEMVRRARAEGQRVARAAAAFGFSRPSYCQATARLDADGLVGLLPQRPGSRRAHKLSDEVVDLLERTLAEDPSLRSADLAARVAERFDLRVHPRSIERALARRRQ